MRAIHPARARFRALLRRPEARLSLAEAALCIAWEEQSADRVAESLRELDVLASGARERLAGSGSAADAVNALNRYLFGELGFKGNTWNYNDLSNSFLDQVLASRVGLPITLSIVYMELGWRLGLPFSGLALPGHFLARLEAGAGAIYIDPFNRGRLWSHAECVTQIATFYGEAPPPLVERIMAPPSKQAILARILRNLKNLYAERGDLDRALAAADRILLLEPDAAGDVRDRGLLRARLGALHGALEDLDRYARLAPGASDLPQIRREARALAERAAAGN
jgi:regulator of sirC expression with transglutaminase-like and TPR domain